MTFFTSVTSNYIPKARILAKTLKQCDPKAVFYLALCDNIPEGFDIENEPFDDIIFTDQLPAIQNPQSFFFRHNVVEACTAVKPATALYLMEEKGAEKVCYLDPDIAVFSPLTEVDTLLDSYSMIFTPHTTIPENESNFIVGNEILFLKRGTNNLGFFAVKNNDEGKRFLNWWDSRLQLFCLDDDASLKELLDEQGLLGLFTDQKWIDMVPSFFDNYYLLKHPGYNVSTWNMSNRHLKEPSNGQYTINDQPLRFFHFSGVDSGAHASVLEHLNTAFPHTKDYKVLSDWYMEQQELAGQSTWKLAEWKYARYSNGGLVPKLHRKVMIIRRDTIPYFKNPFEITEGFCFYNWMMGEYGDYLAKITDTAPPVIPSRDGAVARMLKKIIRMFVAEDSHLYAKLKKIWRAIKY